jgi:hypothetical protein
VYGFHALKAGQRDGDELLKPKKYGSRGEKLNGYEDIHLQVLP